MKRDRQHHCSAGKARNLNALSTIRRCWNVWNPYPVRIFKRSSLNVRSAEPHSIAANRCTQPGAPLRGRTRLLCMQFRLDGRRLYEKTMEPYGSSNRRPGSRLPLVHPRPAMHLGRITPITAARCRYDEGNSFLGVKDRSNQPVQA